MRELHPTLGERFFRKGAIGEGRQAFSRELQEVVDDAAVDLVERLGYNRACP
jgi:hypothetical protein